MDRIFGDKLLKPPLNEQGEVDYTASKMPLLHEARGKVIVKSRVCSCERCRQSLKQYNECVFMPTLKFRSKDGELEEFQQQRSCSSTGRTGRHCSSFTEDKLAHLVDSEVDRIGSLWRLNDWHQHFFSRTYPMGTRFSSTNFDPMDSWAAGVQMAALNYQTLDLPMLLNDGLFASRNQGCGYILKSRKVRGLAQGESPISTVKVEVISGHRLPRASVAVLQHAEEISSPCVKMTLATTEGDHQELVTKTVRNNGFDPHFGFEGEFRIEKEADPELVILVFEVLDKALGQRMCHAAIPLASIRPGLRWLPLHRRSHAAKSHQGVAHRHFGLLVKVELRRGRG
ncbi:unnamed protein product [Polarella glacialis]|uniref:Phosphoinositide phospholipase C n=2 Tax=Polarella glacialis TaxID=89957 RepID=A0A813EFE3_POLGL|nr:unnamed protein product [Polarella glacialis]